MALLPPEYLDAVVALGIPTSSGSIQFSATGFFCSHPIRESEEKTDYGMFLVTNRHVLKGADS